ncbi:molybdenum cofactor guanylyltransferase, partial [Candidatus Aerophobetes bacterium]|nr:molybdenum cofactor guanylyltransferase [Candidatus Aerophobetes bacterium]
MTAIVLAGGKSRRIGENKAFLSIDGKYLIEIVIERLKSVFDHILIVTPEPAAFEFFDAKKVKIIKDVVLNKGALGGIYTGLVFSPDEYNFVCGCDMPFLNPHLLKFMLSRVDDVDALVPVIGGFMEPLHSIYSTRCAGYIKKHLHINDLKIKNFFPEVKCRYLPEEVVRKYDPHLRSFFNLNTSAMLKLA